MAEKSGFFDAHLVNGEYDRVYLAESFAKYFASFIGNGIFGGKSNELQVQQNLTADMSVKILYGQAWINGYWYENDSELSLAIDVADGVLNRIDSIVIRWDNVERVIRSAIKKGTPATNPSAPELQRDADYYELCLAQIRIKAGATKITQADIVDTRLDKNVCGIVQGVVQQFDTTEFGIQLGSFIEQFIESNEAWFAKFKADSASSVEELLDEGQKSIEQVVSNGISGINGVINTGTTNINKLISDKTSEVNQVISTSQSKFDALDTSSKAWFEKFKTDSENDVATLIAELEGLIETSDLASLNTKIANVAERVVALESSMTTFQSNVTVLQGSVDKLQNDYNILSSNLSTFNYLKNMFVQSGPHPGCYYRFVSGENEWVNPPNEIGIEYRTTERWNGKPVYQKLIYVGALPNKTLMSIEVNARFDRIIYISGFAVDSDNNMNYPFPIILNGLSPAAVISYAEGDGGEGSIIIIQTNEDISSFVGYITVKYVKS